jgi:hypothetical protein
VLTSPMHYPFLRFHSHYTSKILGLRHSDAESNQSTGNSGSRVEPWRIRIDFGSRYRDPPS